ncbi:hypothetical protein BC835DRAFT_1422247 [Cytidiella melzeri]|nr:hypothetical protein BC835DRAFT_1422247 [Cytidiella melzeri]
MQAPTSSEASSPTFQPLSSQQSSNTPSVAHRNSIQSNVSPGYTPSPSDTTPASATSGACTNQIPPSSPSTPSSNSSYNTASSTPSVHASHAVPSASLPQSHLHGPSTGINARRAVGGSEAPIDLRGLSTHPSSSGMPASTAVLGAGRTISLPTLKNPQGELLDLNELAGFGDGLTPTQERFSLHSPVISTAPHDVSRSQALTRSPPMAFNISSPAFPGASMYQSPSMCLPSPPMFSSNPSMASFPSLSSLTSSSLSSLTSTPSLGSHPSPSIGSDSGSVTDGLKTPNVYINGLPPNFPEEELLAMTKPFGEVISVRTFTRHVSDKPSGYGFVLFGSVDAAEKCIDSLRKYRNLHPSFSKQIHKIPGTSYAVAHADSAVNLPQRSDEVPDSFKFKMERLKDTSSTNLYMEGLPLSIDEETLQALVTPYRIMSNRFFRTRLSNPPRIIAFVRMESREAAEDIIERLHGRMVRGWCDAGSRISVRFADTSEQRELRRVERTNRDGENSPARLTMAQAALLNLKGTQLGHPVNPRLPSPNFAVVTLPPVIGAAAPVAEPAFVATQAGYRPLPPPIGLHHQTPADTLTLRASNTAPYSGSVAGVAPHDVRSEDAARAAHGVGQADVDLLQMQMAGMGIATNAFAAARAKNGYTPMERLILQAHEQRQQHEALAVATGGAFVQSSHGDAPGAARYGKARRVSEFNPAASEFSPSVTTIGRLQAPTLASAVTAGNVPERKRLVDFLPAMSENDFHSRAYQQEVMMPPTKLEPKGLRLDQESRTQFTRQRNQTHAEAKAQAEAEARGAHTRSTTVPSHYLNTDISRSLHSSMHAVPLSNAVSNSAAARRNADVSQTKNSSSGVRNIGQRMSSVARNTSSVTRSMVTCTGASRSKADAVAQQQESTGIDTGSATAHTRPLTSHDGEDEDEGSGLDSPALSYSARTSASLSPATPFSAFGETFDGPPMAKGEVGLGVGVRVGDVQLVVSGTKGAMANARGGALPVGADTNN